METRARWRLVEAHYLNVQMPDGERVEWEYQETNRINGKSVRKRYDVPMLLDPKDRSCWNYPEEIIVSNKPGGNDIVYVGPPTPGMEPLNDEAERITHAESPKWAHPINDMGSTYGEDLFQKLTRQLEAVMAHTPIPKADATPVGVLTVEQAAELDRQMRKMQQENEQLRLQLAGEEPEAEESLDDPVPPPAPATAERRV